MSKHGVALSKRRKVSVPNRNVSSKVSKVSSICGYLLAFCCYSIWVSSSFVTADKHTYGSINESNGLCVLLSPSFTFTRSVHLFPCILLFFIDISIPIPFTLTKKKKKHKHISSIHSRSDIETSNCRTNHTRANQLHHHL